MPATSRSGERFRRRSGSGRAGSPSKSRIDPAAVGEHASGRGAGRRGCGSRARRRPTCESAGSRSRTSCAAAARSAPTASVSGRSRNTRSICSSTSAVRIESASVDGSSGANAGSLEVRAERGVQLADHRRRAPRGRSSSASGSLAQLVERELPAVARAGEVLLQDPERRVEQAALDLVPAGQRRDVREAVRGQEAQQLELRVHARLDAPERLQDQLLAEHDRGVRLLDADRAHVDGPAEPRAGALAPSGR